MASNEAYAEMMEVKEKLRREAEVTGAAMEKTGKHLEAHIQSEVEKSWKVYQDIQERKERAEGRRLEQQKMEMKLAMMKEVRENPNMSLVDDHDSLNISVNAQRPSKSPMPKMDKFDENRDRIDSYIARFENYAENTTWSDVDKANAFSCYLVGVPLDIYHSLSAASQRKFSAIKEELLKHNKISEASYKSRFFNSRCKKDVRKMNW